MFELRVESGPDKGRVFTLCEGVNSIGRSAANSCPINDASASRSHCVITIVGERAVIENKSRYGTLIAGTPIETPFSLAEGQRIQLGYSLTELSFHKVAKNRGSVEAVEPVARREVVPVQRSEAELLLSRELNVDRADSAGKPLNDDSFISGFPPVGGVERRKPEESAKSSESLPRATPSTERKFESAATDEEMESELIPRATVSEETSSSDGSKFIPLDKKLLDNFPLAEPLTRMDTGGLVDTLRQNEIKKYRKRRMAIIAVLVGLCIILTAAIWSIL